MWEILILAVVGTLAFISYKVGPRRRGDVRQLADNVSLFVGIATFVGLICGLLFILWGLQMPRQPLPFLD